MAGMNFRFKDNTSEVMKRVTEKINLGLDLAGEVIEGYAKDDCPQPVDTGLLRNSITHAHGGGAPAISSYHADNPKEGRKNSGSYPGAVDGQQNCEYIGTNVEYAQNVEFGSHKHLVGKSHFLRDAGENHIDEIRDVLQKTLNTI